MLGKVVYLDGAIIAYKELKMFQHLQEMASRSPPMTKLSVAESKNFGTIAETYPEEHAIDDNTLKVKRTENSIAAMIIDKNKEAKNVGHFTITHTPIPHMKQDFANSTDDAAIGAQRKLVFKIIDTTDYPLKTDDSQTDAGHNMWRKLVPDALDRGLHVHYYDGENFHKTTKDNMNDHLDSYFNQQNRHMFISKNEIQHPK